MARARRNVYPFVERLTRYAEDVVAEKIPAGKYTILACKRHLDDLEKSKTDEDYPYYFDEGAANTICAFAQLMPHVKGQWARRQELLNLQDWQCFCFGVPFGWKKKKNDRRRFLELYYEVARKNGKSIVGAVIGNYMFLLDNEFGAEIFSGATSEKQAWEVFGPAKLMLQKSPDILDDGGVEVFAQSMVRAEDKSSFKPLIGNPGDGASPSCAIIDEYHEHPTSNLYDTMMTGMGAREQPLCVIITTAGVNLAGPCFDKHLEAQKVLEGSIENDQLFTIIYAADLEGENLWPGAALEYLQKKCNCAHKESCAEPKSLETVTDYGVFLQEELWKHAEDCKAIHRVKVKDGGLLMLGDDWAHPDTLRKANPNFGISVDEDFLLGQQRNAVINAEQQNRFKTKHLNIWCSAMSAWMNTEWWRLCGDPGLSIDDFKGKKAHLIIDLAARNDICAYAKIFTQDIKGLKHYYAFGKYFLPEAAVEEPGPNHTIYKKWQAQGLLTVTDGTEVDFDLVRREIEADKKQFRIVEIMSDDWQSAHLTQELGKTGGTIISVPMTAKNLSPGMREIEAAVKAGRFHHNGDPVMAWMISNVVAKEDANENLFPRKQGNKKEYKIDIATCLIMGVARIIASKEKQYQAMSF